MKLKLTEEQKQHIEEQIGHPDYFQCASGKFAIDVFVKTGVAGDMYTEFSPGQFSLNMQIVSQIPC